MSKNINLKSDYLRQTLIDYIGRKEEKDLTLIDKAISYLMKKDKETFTDRIPTFVDLFSGTGAVSRYAFYKGFKVIGNDLENYAQVSTNVPIHYNREEVEEIFKKVFENLKLPIDSLYDPNVDLSWSEVQSYYKTVLAHLNQLKKPRYLKNQYFASAFAPKKTNEADIDNERLFYSAENALKIDAIVEMINSRAFSNQAKEIVLASLFPAVLEVVNNQNKTTKNYRKEITRGNKKVRERVLSELQLNPIVFLSKNEISTINPDLLLEENRSYAVKGYAEGFFMKRKDIVADITYLDPPYTQQQYSKNYSHLISICANDKPVVEGIEKGNKFESRQDLNESYFCRRLKERKSGKKLAEIALKHCFDNISSRYVIYSYLPNTILTIPEIVKVFSDNGSHSIQLIFRDKQELGDILLDSRDEHCIIIIEKHRRQMAKEVDILTKELVERALIAENETLAISNRFLNIFSLCENHPDWYYITHDISKRHRLFHKDKFMGELTYELLMLGNIDLEFTEEEIKIIEEFSIQEREVNFVLSLSKKKIKDFLPRNFAKEQEVTKRKETIDAQSLLGQHVERKDTVQVQSSNKTSIGDLIGGKNGEKARGISQTQHEIRNLMSLFSKAEKI